ncbi:MAG: UvrD-helicase domain-containing protein, partial [Delftia sp.]|nr:UvrD-helicase domain-containing protein [Delftia sp.]
MTKLHSVVAQLEPSAEQKPAILARGSDVIVVAGAGTGKPRTLVARYLSLLAENLPLRAIVAITFSKKAAREMRNRVREEMRRYLQTADSEHWQDLYRQLDAARIGTIHSLCTEILRAHPAEARVDPRFEVLDEGQANVLQAQALEAALAWAAKDREAARLFALLGERSLRMTLNTLLRQRLKVQDPPANPLECWQRALLQRQEPALSALVSSAPWQDAVATIRYSAAHKADDRMEIQRRSALAAVQQAQQGTLPERLASLARLRGIVLRGGSKNSWPGGKDELEDVRASLKALRELWKEQSDLLELALTPQDEALAGAIPALHAAFDLTLARYDTLKQERHVLDFDDLESGALALL